MTSLGVHSSLFLGLRCARSSSSTRSIVSTSLCRFLPDVDALDDVATPPTSESSIVIVSCRDVSLTEAVGTLLLVGVGVGAAGTTIVAFSLPFERPLVADVAETGMGGGWA